MYEFVSVCASVYMQGPNPSVLIGALVGGPDNNDRFSNSRANYVENEVGLDYNAGESCMHRPRLQPV